LLCTIGGNDAPDAAAVTKVLESVGVEVDADKLAGLITSLEGKSLDELIAAGKEKLAAAGPAGGAGGDAAAGGDAPAAAAAVEEEEEEEAAPAMDMFGGDEEEEGDY